MILVNGIKVDSETELNYSSNPKRVGFKAHARYEEYEDCQTLFQYLYVADPKYAKADLRYDQEHGHLEIVSDDTED